MIHESWSTPIYEGDSISFVMDKSTKTLDTGRIGTEKLLFQLIQVKFQRSHSICHLYTVRSLRKHQIMTRIEHFTPEKPVCLPHLTLSTWHQLFLATIQPDPIKLFQRHKLPQHKYYIWTEKEPRLRMCRVWTNHFRHPIESNMLRVLFLFHKIITVSPLTSLNWS